MAMAVPANSSSGSGDEGLSARFMSAARRDLPGAMFKLGFATCVTAGGSMIKLMTAAAVVQPVTWVITGVAFLGGVATIGFGFWLARAGAPSDDVTQAAVLCASTVPLVVSVAAAGAVGAVAGGVAEAAGLAGGSLPASIKFAFDIVGV